MTGASPFRVAQQGIAYVPEGRGIFGNLSVKENLIMAARAGTQGQRDWTYERVLDTFPRLKERLTNGGQQLSGGEQQMLTIGRALMTNPDVLILDEATEGLAPLIAREIWRICGVIRDSGISSMKPISLICPKVITVSLPRPSISWMFIALMYSLALE